MTSAVTFMRPIANLFLGLCSYVLLLNVCLWLVDFPAIDSYPAEHVKKMRYPARHHVYRDEDYSQYYVNSYGLIGMEPLPVNRQDVYRIAVFGDSLVEALQVSHADKFTTLIEQMLVPPPPYTVVEVWNFSFSGDNTGNAFARWIYQASAIQFNLVIFSFNDTDVWENRTTDLNGPTGAFLVEQTDGSFQLDESFAQEHSGRVEYWMKCLLGRFFYSSYVLKLRATDLITSKTTTVKQLAQRRSGTIIGKSDGASPSTQAAQDNLRAASEHTCRQLMYVQGAISRNGVSIILLGLPSGVAVLPGEIAKNPLRHDSYLAVASCLARAGVPFLDMYPVLWSMTTKTRDPYSDWEPGAHLNRQGHQLVTEALLPAMKRQYHLESRTDIVR